MLVKFLKQHEFYILEKTFKNFKNYSKIQENLRVTYKIFEKIYLYLSKIYIKKKSHEKLNIIQYNSYILQQIRMFKLHKDVQKLI